MKFSIILPVYNVEKYLKECLDSIINQTLQDFEVLCINDGSTDGCLEILNEYSAKDNRIKVYSKKKEGQGVARNFGLKLATGEFISFIDPDDWIEPTLLEDSYNAAIANNANVVRFLHRAYYEDTDTIVEHPYVQAIKPNSFNYYQDLGDNFLAYSNAPCNKIYSREFLINNNILFSSARIAEDQPFGIKLKLITPFFYLDKFLYNYRIHNDSTTFIQKHNPIEEIESCKKIIKDLDLEEELSECFENYIINRLFKIWDDSKLFFNTYIQNRQSFPYTVRRKINKLIIKKLIIKHIPNILSVRNKYDSNIKYKYFYFFGFKILLTKQECNS